jgi:plastocyanin
MARKLAFFSAVVAVFAAIAVPALAHLTIKTQTVAVAASEYKFTLSKKAVPTNTRIIFKVTNNGAAPHDFKIAGKKTPLLQSQGNSSFVVIFKKKGKYTYLCTVPGHAQAGMKGVLVVK